GFELGLAGAAEKTKTSALTLKMGPRAHQPALLVGQMRMLDLQRTFARARPPAENFKDQTGTIQDLGVPGLFNIAPLYRGDRAIHHDQVGAEGLHDPGDLVDLALTEVGCRPD